MPTRAFVVCCDGILVRRPMRWLPLKPAARRWTRLRRSPPDLAILSTELGDIERHRVDPPGTRRMRRTDHRFDAAGRCCHAEPDSGQRRRRLHRRTFLAQGTGGAGAAVAAAGRRLARPQRRGDRPRSDRGRSAGTQGADRRQTGGTDPQGIRCARAAGWRERRHPVARRHRAEGVGPRLQRRQTEPAPNDQQPAP